MSGAGGRRDGWTTEAAWLLAGQRRRAEFLHRHDQDAIERLAEPGMLRTNAAYLFRTAQKVTTLSVIGRMVAQQR